MLNTPILKYFWEINSFNIPLAIVIGISSGLIYGLILFCSAGILFGLFGFNYFKNNEYYTYYNLGYSKLNLIKKVFFSNIIIASGLLLIITIIR